MPYCRTDTKRGPPAAPAEAKGLEELFRNLAGVDNLRVAGEVIGTTAEHPQAREAIQ
jgi:hypothetical protein